MKNPFLSSGGADFSRSWNHASTFVWNGSDDDDDDDDDFYGPLRTGLPWAQPDDYS